MGENENNEEIKELYDASKRCRQGLVNTKEEAIKAVKYNGINLKYLGKEFQNDEDVVKEALHNVIDSVHFIGNELKNNKEFILNIIKSTDNQIKNAVLREVLRDNDNSLKKDGDFLNELALVSMDNAGYDGNTIIYSVMDLLEKENMMSDEVKEKFDKLNKESTPYYRVAKKALMEWNGLSEEEATKKVDESSFDEIESQVYAKKSMLDGLKGMINSINSYYTDSLDKIKNDKELENAIFDMNDDVCIVDGDVLTGSYINGFRNELEIIDRREKNNSDISLDDFYIDGLSSIHNGWVEDNASKFMKRDKKYQHLPMELIGWEEAKKDMLFLEPIISEDDYDTFMKKEERELKRAYENRVDKYLEEHNINSKEDLINLITTGSDFYSSLDGQDEIVEALKDPKFVETEIVSKIDPEILSKIDSRKEVKKDDDLMKSLLKREVVESDLRNFLRGSNENVHTTGEAAFSDRLKSDMDHIAHLYDDKRKKREEHNNDKEDDQDQGQTQADD